MRDDCYYCQTQGSDRGHGGVRQSEHVTTAVPNPQEPLLQCEVLLSDRGAAADQCSVSTGGERNRHSCIHMQHLKWWFEEVKSFKYITVRFNCLQSFTGDNDHGGPVQHWTWAGTNELPS